MLRYWLFGFWGHVIIMTAASHVLGVFKNVGLIFFGTLLQFFCVQIAVNHAFTLYNENVGLQSKLNLPVVGFSLTVTEHPIHAIHTKRWKQIYIHGCLCTYAAVCVCVCFTVVILQFCNAGLLSVFAVFLSVTKTGIKRDKAGSLL